MDEQSSDLQTSNDSQKGGVELGMAKIFVFSCPYLGTPDDEDTSLAYPAAANHCFKTNSATAIDLSHQESYCLTEQHRSCHIYSNAESANREPAVVQSAAPKKGKRRLSLYALPIILVLILLAAIIWWPAPGTTIQESLVRGAQNDRAVSGGATLTGKPVSQPQEADNGVEVEPSEQGAESITGPNLNDSGAEEGIASGAGDSNAVARNEDAASLERSSASAEESMISAGQVEEAPQVAEPGGSPPDPAVSTIAESAETEGAVEVVEDTNETTASMDVSIEESAVSAADSEVAEETNEELATSVADFEESTAADDDEETTSVAVIEESAAADNDQEAAASTGEEFAAAEMDEESDRSVETEGAEDESTAVFTADLPVLSTDSTAIAAAVETTVAVNDASPSLIMVGPTSSTALSLAEESEETRSLPVYQSPAGAGGQLSVIEERQFATLLGRDNSGQWLNIRLADGTEGWVNANQSGSSVGGTALLPVTEAPSTLAATSYPVIRQAFVDTGALNLRSGPGVEYASISILNQGQLVGLIGRRALGPWVRIRLDDGAEGWVNSSLLAPIS